MKKSVFVALFFYFAASLFAFDPEKTVAVSQGAKKYTKTLYSITQKFGEYFRIPQSKYVHTFNEKGQEIESSEYTAKDVLIDKMTFQYNDKGLLETQSYFASDGALVWKTVTTYKDDNKTEDAEYDKDGVLSGKTIYLYKDNLIEETYYNAEGELLCKNISQKDSTGKIAKISQYNAKGSLDTLIVPTYNDEGKEGGAEVFNAAGILAKKTVFRNNADGLLSEELTYNTDNVLVARKLLKYNEQKNLSRVTTYSVSQKFGSTITELTSMTEYTYE